MIERKFITRSTKYQCYLCLTTLDNEFAAIPFNRIYSISISNNNCFQITVGKKSADTWLVQRTSRQTVTYCLTISLSENL